MVYFSRDTNMNNYEVNEQFFCELMFGPLAEGVSSCSASSCSSAVYLGTGSTCAFKTPTTLLVTLGQNPTVVPFSTIMFRDAPDLRSSNGKSDGVAGGYITVNAGDGDGLKSVAVITTASEIGRCDEVRLDGTLSSGSGGRDFSATYWESSEPKNTTTDQVVEGAEATRKGALITAHLSATSEAGDLMVTVPNDYLTPGLSYVFHLTVVNFFGATSTHSVTVRKLEIDIPQVLVRGPETVPMVVQDFMSLTADADFPETCGDGSSDSLPANLDFVWRVVKVSFGAEVRECKERVGARSEAATSSAA